MSEDMHSLRIPVAVWTGGIPHHPISAIALAFPQPTQHPRQYQPQLIQSPHFTPSPQTPEKHQRHGVNNSEQSDAAAALPPPIPLVCPSLHPPHAFILTGSETGELAHWTIPTYKSNVKEKRKCGSNRAIPRSLLLRQGSSSCTAVCYCRAGADQLFCSGSSEGFLTLWSVHGGHCLKSELVLPYAPTQIIFYQRYNPIMHEKRLDMGRKSQPNGPSQSPTRSPSPSPSPSPQPLGASAAHAIPPSPSPPAQPPVASPPRTVHRPSSSPPPTPVSSTPNAATSMQNYLICCSAGHSDVYVVELPSLTVLAILEHRSTVMSMSLMSASSSRLPFLVTITEQHHICMWDMSLIEKKREEARKIKQQQIIHNQGRARSAAHNRAAAHAAASAASQPLIPDLTHPPTSSLASHSASIILPSALHGSSSRSGIPVVPLSSVIVHWDEPTRSFLLALPPFAFTFASIFTPVSICLSLTGERAIIVFPYAFMSVNLHTYEVETPLQCMAYYLRSESDGSMDVEGRAWSEEGMRACTAHAPFAGAGFLTSPTVTKQPTLTSHSPKTSHRRQPPPSPSSPAVSSETEQYLVVWNQSGELIWLFALRGGSVDGDDGPRHRSSASTRDELAIPMPAASPSSTGMLRRTSSLKRSLSTSKLALQQKAASPVAIPHALEDGTRSVENPMASPKSHAPSTPNSTMAPPLTLQLVARCSFTKHDDSIASEAMANVGNAPNHLQPHSTSSRPSSRAPFSCITVYLSGHAIFAGTEHGDLLQWHVPICHQSSPLMLTSTVRTLSPTHVSRIADGFNDEHNHAPDIGATKSDVDSGPPGLPKRALTAPIAITPPHLTPKQVGSTASPPPSAASPQLCGSSDPACTSLIMVDVQHEAVLLAVGHSSGMIKIHNLLSKAATHLDLPDRHCGPVTAMLNVSDALSRHDAKGECLLATAGLDGKLLLFEAGTGTLTQTILCNAPIISLHKPMIVAHDAVGDTNSLLNNSLIYSDCADGSIRCFSLLDGDCVFVGHGLDAPVKGVFRNSWCIMCDYVICLTTRGTVYIYSMSDGMMMQSITVEEGANAFLQTHDIIAPGSQLAILAHKLRQADESKRAQAPNDTTTVDNSRVNRHQQQPTDHSNARPSPNPIPRSRDDTTVELAIVHDSPSPSTASQSPPTSIAVAPRPPVTSYQRPRVLRMQSTISLTPIRNPVHATTPSTFPRPMAKGRLGVPVEIDQQFQRDVYRLNAQQRQARHEEQMRHQQQAQHRTTQWHVTRSPSPQHTVSGTYGPLLSIHHANPSAPSHHSPTPPALSHPESAGVASQSQYAQPPSKHIPPHSTTPAPDVGTAGPTRSFTSPSPPAHKRHPSPVTCVEVVGSGTSSVSPMQHLHVNVYVFNIHQLIAFLPEHAATLADRARRTAAMHASRLDPASPATHAQMNANRAVPLPPAFYVVCGLLSTLMDWESETSIEPALRQHLRLYCPTPPVSFASLSDHSQSLTLLLPNQYRHHQRWAVDGHVTANYQTAISTCFMQIIDKTEPNTVPVNAFNTVLHYYQHTLPTSHPIYMDSDVRLLAGLSLSMHRAIHTAARTLLRQRLARLSSADRLSLCESYGRFYAYALPPQRRVFQPEFNLSNEDLVSSGSVFNVVENGAGIGIVSDEEMMVATILCYCGLMEMQIQKQQQQQQFNAKSANGVTAAVTTPSNESVTEFHAKSQYITNTLLRSIAWPVTNEPDAVKCSLACDLLAAGLSLFRLHITEPQLLFHRLFTLKHDAHYPICNDAALGVLMEAGKVSPAHFINCMAREALSYRNTPVHRQDALMTIVQLIKHNPIALARSLPALVQMIVRCLDPSEPTLRKTLFTASSSVLYSIAVHYPSTSFDKTSQRVAVGSCAGAGQPNAIVVWDLNTATKWRVLEGHRGDIHALAFHPKGTMIASYSGAEAQPSVRVWTMGGGGFLAGLLGMEGKCTHSWTLPPCVKCNPNSKGATEDEMNHAAPHVTADAHVHTVLHAPSSPPPTTSASTPPPSSLHHPSSTSSSASSSRFPISDLLHVRLMWLSEKALKLRREDGQVIDYHMG